MMHLVTGYAGYEHIKSEDEGSYNAAFFGDGQFVMEIGRQFQAEILNNNTIRIYDGDGMMYGRHFRIKKKGYQDIAITTGTAGTNRCDLICNTYQLNEVDGTEAAGLQVIEGEAVSGSADLPAYIDGNILEGAKFNQMPMYKVNIEGVVLKSVVPLFKTQPTYRALAERYEQEFKEACETHLDSLNILDTLEEVEANTQGNQLAGALALKELSSDVATAQSTANKGVTNASNAQNTANSALSKANAALPKANFSFDKSTGTLNITL